MKVLSVQWWYCHDLGGEYYFSIAFHFILFSLLPFWLGDFFASMIYILEKKKQQDEDWK